MPDPNHHFGICSRFLFFALPVNIDQNPNANEAEEEIRSAIADKRQAEVLYSETKKWSPRY